MCYLGISLKFPKRYTPQYLGLIQRVIRNHPLNIVVQQKAA